MIVDALNHMEGAAESFGLHQKMVVNLSTPHPFRCDAVLLYGANAGRNASD